MNIDTFKQYWDSNKKHPTQDLGIPTCTDTCSDEVLDFLDKIGKASPQELAELLPLEDIPDEPIIDDCSAEVGAFLDQIAAAKTNEELAKLLKF